VIYLSPAPPTLNGASPPPSDAIASINTKEISLLGCVPAIARFEKTIDPAAAVHLWPLMDFWTSGTRTANIPVSISRKGNVPRIPREFLRAVHRADHRSARSRLDE